MTPIRYIVMNTEQCADRTVKCGDTVFQSMKYDYGLARDDSNHFNKEFVSVTKNEDGDYPSFTIPLSDLVEVSTKGEQDVH